jgi:N-formylglutamate amidohydrolase
MILSAILCLASFKSDLVEVVDGDLPIVITAPHGGVLPIPGADERKDTTLPQFVTVLDTRTDDLARETAKQVEKEFGKKPFVIIARFARKYADANRPAKYGTESEAARLVHAEYHEAVRKAVDAVRTKFGKGIFVDIHGQAADKETVFRGTQNLKTVTGVTDESLFGPKSFLGMLESQGIKVFPTMKDAHEKENPKFDGGYTVQSYGLGHDNGILAIQLEFGGSYRTVKAIPETAKKLALALKSHVDSH